MPLTGNYRLIIEKAEIALQLEDVMPEIPARFWLDLETDYQLTRALINKRTRVE